MNVDLPLSAVELLVLTMHETYPGHHLERCCKEHLLVRQRGLLEKTLVLIPTPQSVVSEGIAVLAPSMVFESDGGGTIDAVLDDAGIHVDLAHALAVWRALEPCRRAEVNAALMLHEEGVSETEVRACLERWGRAEPGARGPRGPVLHRADVEDVRSPPTTPAGSCVTRTWPAIRSDFAACSRSRCASATCSKVRI